MNTSLYLKFYKNLCRIRAFESLVADFFRKGKFCQPICSGIGEEAGGVVIATLLKKGDWLIPPSHRALSYVISRGAPLKSILAEMTAKKEGATRGFSGDRFVFPEMGIMGYSNSMGANFSLAVGLGLAAKRRKKIVVCIFGDGAASRSTFHSALNTSALWKLPILWVCQNNQFSISARFSKICAVKNIADRGRGYDISGIVADGNDVLEIYKKTKGLVDSIRRNCHPAFLELKTYRISTHYVGEARRYLYQNRKEISFWEKRDPAVILIRKLRRAGILSANFENGIKNKIEKEIKSAKDFCALLK